MLASLFQTFILSSVILQVIWIGLSVFGLARLYYLNSRLKFSPDEQAFLDAAMPDLSKIDARKFLNVALVIDGEPGTRLTHEGEPISHLIYLLNGEAVVFSGGVEVARIQEGHYIGDVTYMLGEPATASVDVAKPSRYLAFEVTALRAFLEKNAAVKRRLEQSAADNLRKKLTATTKTAASQRTAQAAE
ncbi:MAG: cyclic nucleotide-binding domain-containing protein [Pseudomonadota bacterium]